MDREYMESNLESIREMAISNETFVTSKLCRLIKRGKITLDGVEFLLENFSNVWWVRDAIIEHAKVSYKDAIKIKFSNILFDNGAYLHYYKNMTNFFSSSKEVHEFALEHFGINFYAPTEILKERYKKIKEDKEKEVNLKSFLSTFLTPQLAKAEIFKDSEKRKELVEIFEDLPLIAGMAKMDFIIYKKHYDLGPGHTGAIGYLLSSEFYSVPIVDLDKHIEFIEKNVHFESFKKRAYLKMFNTLFYNIRNPKIRYINTTKGFKFLLNNFISSLDSSFCENSDLVEVLSNVKSAQMFPYVKDVIYEDIVCDEVLLSKLKGYCYYDYMITSMITTLLGSSPLEKINETYKKICKAFPKSERIVHSAILTLSSTVEDFDVTREIALSIINSSSDWDRLVLPLKDIHNEEFLEMVVRRVGKMNMLTGGYSEFFMKNLQPALLSESFINKYEDYIDWGDLSRNKNLTLDFIKKHKEKIKINSLDSSIIRILDEEILEYFIQNNKASKFYLGNLSSVENISFDFAKKYMEILVTENYRNLSIGSKGAFKLADFVASLT